MHAYPRSHDNASHARLPQRRDLRADKLVNQTFANDVCGGDTVGGNGGITGGCAEAGIGSWVWLGRDGWEGREEGI